MSYPLREALTRRDRSTDQLTADLSAFCERHGLAPESADEILCRLCDAPRVNRPLYVQERIDWLAAFCAAWDAAQEREDAARRH